MTVFNILFLCLISYACKDTGSSAPRGESSSPPSVTTMKLTDVNATSAEAHGRVTDDGGLSISERGIAWDTLSGPTIDQNYAEASGADANGEFSATLENLKENTTYHLRAYAKNDEGISYGHDLSFATNIDGELPSVETMEVTTIKATSAEAYGKIIDNGGLAIGERGIAWDTLSGPTIDQNYAEASGFDASGKFSAFLQNLNDSTTYYIRAYAKNSEGISYGTETSFVTKVKSPTEIKKGVAGGKAAAIHALNVGSYYTWGSKLKDDKPKDVEFVPMIWGYSGNKEGLENTISYVNSLAKAGKAYYLLGFNEPDNKGQSNMSVEKAIEAWPTLMEANVPLGSPGADFVNGPWMEDFMAKVDELGYRVDFIAVHSYRQGVNANGFINWLKKIHNKYNRPIWITEWAVRDFTAESPEDNRYTPEQVKTYMSKVLPRLEALDWVKRYYWYPFNGKGLGPSVLYKNNATGELTELGKYYANFKSGPQRQ